MELESQTFVVLEGAGIKEGQIILDFGCGSGTYTIPPAKIVGKQGKIYALDKDKKALDELMQKAGAADLRNIKRMDTLDEIKGKKHKSCCSLGSKEQRPDFVIKSLPELFGILSLT